MGIELFDEGAGGGGEKVYGTGAKWVSAIEAAAV